MAGQTVLSGILTGGGDDEAAIASANASGATGASAVLQTFDAPELESAPDGAGTYAGCTGTGSPTKGISATGRHCHVLPTWVCATRLTDFIVTWIGDNPTCALLFHRSVTLA
jgi:hypothetical protein